MPCSRTQHGLTRVGLEPPASGSGVRGINHQATALPYQNIEIEYNLGNFVSFRTGKIDFFNTLVVCLRRIASAKYENNFMLVFLHIKVFDILQVLQIFHYKGAIMRDAFTPFLKIMSENSGKLSPYISKTADVLKHMCNDQTFENGDKLGILQLFETNLYYF